MADEHVKQTRYTYALNSNLVLSGQNRDGGEKAGARARADLPTGEGETLVGRRLAAFGDRAVKERPKEEQVEKGKKQFEAPRSLVPGKAESEAKDRHTLKDVNFAALQVEQDLIYRPRTKETQVHYEQIMHMVQRYLGHSSIETMKDAVDEILAVLKDENLNDGQRKAEIDGFLGLEQLTDDEFNTMTVLASCLTDYGIAKDEVQEKGQPSAAVKEQEQDIAIDLDQDDEQSQVGNVDADVGHAQVAEIVEESASEKANADSDQDQIEEKPAGEDAQMQEMSQSLSLQHVDAHWLKRYLIEQMPGLIPEDVPNLESSTMAILESFCQTRAQQATSRDCEKELTELFANHKSEQSTHISVVSYLVKNRFAVFFGVRMNQETDPKIKDELVKMMEATQEGRSLVLEMKMAGVKEKQNDDEKDLLSRAEQALRATEQPSKPKQKELKVLELEVLRFQQGGRLMANKKCILPKGSTRVTKPGYEEVFVPAVKKKTAGQQELIPISRLPAWARPAFPAYMTELNRIQSALYQAAFETPVNLLVCAPTGAGKTNIAMLACLQLLGEMRSTESTGIDQRVNYNLRQFKIIYIAPMKALVTEVVGNFQRRLECFGIKVRELTGDAHLTKQQIEEANIIVTTPEKWDIITRKSGERAYVDLVKLIIIDEVHLLHDTRGPVLESIIARTIRQIEETQELVRIVGLSATLPNYKDVAQLLRVDPAEGLFYFDSSYKPVPLEQIYVGISEKKAIKKVMLMNEVCYQKVVERIEKFQVLVFVHSRKETSRTAKIIRDMAIAQDKQDTFVKEDSESKRILMEVIVTKKLAVSQDLKDLVPFGIGIHHAGLSKDDRTLVEDLFAAGHIKVLISTATLAWGVNLPAHTVIIKGTQAYNPELGKWVELSPQDILQMMGRAGRPQYDTQGEGIIITNHADLQYYLSLNNQQLPIESQMIQALSDQMNAEIVQGSITNLKEAVLWLSYTYLHIRMRKNPQLYGISEEDHENDPSMLQVRMNLAHSAALKLQRSGMIAYDKRSGALMATALGKVASHYYVKCESMLVYNEELKPHMSTIDLFRLFASSKEFENIPIRENEKVELQKFIDRVPIPVKGGIEEPSTKINILLQAYIARFRLEGFDLNSDLVFVTQSASRIMRALFEIAIKKGWAQLSENLLNVCKMIDRRQWYCATPLRQFAAVLESSTLSHEVTMAQDLQEIARRIERKDQFRWTDLSDFSAQRLGELIKYPKMGKIIQGYVQRFPRLEISAFVQPITRSNVRIELEVKAHENFLWDGRFHGKAETFWILVSDGDSENILHSEQFILYESQTKMEHHLSFTVPLFDPLPPQYFIKVLSDRWLQAEHVIPVSFQNLILPDKYAALTKLHDMQQKLVKELDLEEAEEIFTRFERMTEFSPIQSQVFDQLYHSNDSVFLGVPQGGSESRILAELAIFREIQQESFSKIVYISPNFQHCRSLHEIWSKRLSSASDEEGFGLCVELLSQDVPGSLQQDLQQIKRADLIIATSAKWEALTRKWRARSSLQQVSLYLFDHLHLIHDTQSQQSASTESYQAAQYETLISRVRYMQTELQQQSKQTSRIVALSAPIATAKDICDWLGISFDRSCFNFGPSVRESCPSLGPLQVNIQSFDHNGRRARICQMIKPTYNQVKQCFSAMAHRSKGDKARALVFTSDLKTAQSLALDLVNYCIADESDHLFKGKPLPKNSPIRDEELNQLLGYGVAWAYADMPAPQLEFLKQCYIEGSVKVLVAPFSTCWSLQGANSVKADLVVIQDPQVYNAVEKRYQIISVSTIIQMQSLAISNELNSKQRTRSKARSVIMCHGPLKDYFAKYISEPLPVESLLPQNLHEHLNSAVAASEIQSIQECIDWITWTFMYRRISKNPNYYEIAGRTGQHINDYLSELVEDTVAELAETGCLSVAENEVDLEVANLGRIASYYCLSYQTVEVFARSFNLNSEESDAQPPGSIKLKQILETLCQSAEVTNIVQAVDVDEALLRQLALNLPIDISRHQDFTDPHITANILLQCHLSRRAVHPTALSTAQHHILRHSVNLVHSLIDVISSSLSASLKPAILCMELSQMLVQAMWTSQSPLLQLPFMTNDVIETLHDRDGVQDIADLMNMEDDRRDKVLNISEKQMMALAAVCNRYPNNELEVEAGQDRGGVDLDARDGESNVEVEVVLRRDIQEEDFEGREEYLEELKIFKQPVNARLYPKSKEENWWVLAGHVASGKLLSIKKITNLSTNPRVVQTLSLPVSAQLLEKESESNQRMGALPIKIYAVCDSYIGCDLEKDYVVKISNKRSRIE